MELKYQKNETNKNYDIITPSFSLSLSLLLSLSTSLSFSSSISFSNSSSLSLFLIISISLSLTLTLSLSLSLTLSLSLSLTLSLSHRLPFKSTLSLPLWNNIFTILSANAFACSSFLDFEGAPTAFGLESLRVTVRLKTKEWLSGAYCVGGRTESLSTTKNPNLSNWVKIKKEMRIKMRIKMETEMMIQMKIEKRMIKRIISLKLRFNYRNQGIK